MHLYKHKDVMIVVGFDWCDAILWDCFLQGTKASHG